MPPVNHDNETYLEAVVEHIQSCPAEVRRNLDLMHDLDQTSAQCLEQLHTLQRCQLKWQLDYPTIDSTVSKQLALTAQRM